MTGSKNINRITRHRGSIVNLARVFCCLIILGSSAIAAYAQTPIDPFAGDAHVILNDPSCPQVFCIQLTFTGSKAIHNFFFSAVPGGLYPPPDTCASNVFEECHAKRDDHKFIGFQFEDGKVTPGELLDISSNVPILLMLPAGLSCNPPSSCQNGIIPLGVTPEPSSSILFMTGLLLFSLGGFVRKRLGANFPPKCVG